MKILSHLRKMCIDPDVMLHFPKVLSEDESLEYFDRIITRQQETGKVFWAVELKDNHQFYWFYRVI